MVREYREREGERVISKDVIKESRENALRLMRMEKVRS